MSLQFPTECTVTLKRVSVNRLISDKLTYFSCQILDSKYSISCIDLEAVNQLKNLEGSINICQFKVFCDRSRPCFCLPHSLCVCRFFAILKFDQLTSSGREREKNVNQLIIVIKLLSRDYVCSVNVRMRQNLIKLMPKTIKNEQKQLQLSR